MLDNDQFILSRSLRPKAYEIPLENLSTYPDSTREDKSQRLNSPMVNYYTPISFERENPYSDEIPIYQANSHLKGSSLPETPQPASLIHPSENSFGYPIKNCFRKPLQENSITVPPRMHITQETQRRNIPYQPEIITDVVIIENERNPRHLVTPWNSKLPVNIKCRRCGRIGLTKVKGKISTERIAFILLMALFCFIWAVCCMPCVSKVYEHRCRYCNAFAGRCVSSFSN